MISFKTPTDFRRSLEAHLKSILLKQYRPINRMRFKDTLQKVYGMRGTHTLPENLGPPSSDWLPLFESLAAECGLSQSMQESYLGLQEFFQNHVLEI